MIYDLELSYWKGCLELDKHWYCLFCLLFFTLFQSLLHFLEQEQQKCWSWSFYSFNFSFWLQRFHFHWHCVITMKPFNLYFIGWIPKGQFHLCKNQLPEVFSKDFSRPISPALSLTLFLRLFLFFLFLLHSFWYWVQFCVWLCFSVTLFLVFI